MTTLTDRIEQCRAAGRDLAWVVEHLEVDAREVLRVWRLQDEANGSEDTDREIYQARRRQPTDKKTA